MKNILSIFFVFLVTLNNCLGRGSEGGGGGETYEDIVYEIRDNILTWIEAGNAINLNFDVSNDVTLDAYEKKMREFLSPGFVEVFFVEKDDPTDSELQVVVDGKPKTCRGFFSKQTNKPTIICNLYRFKIKTRAERFRLIHHEYAGLAYLEKNDGSLSDYTLSNQITDKLEFEIVLKLPIKKKVEVPKTPNAPIGSSKLILNPVHPGSGLPFLFRRGFVANGICKSLGYGAGLNTSVKGSETLYPLVLSIDENGLIKKADKNSRKVDKIICQNKLPHSVKEVSYIVENPVHPGSNLPISSILKKDEFGFHEYYRDAEFGVCKSLGFKKGVDNSILWTENKMDVLVMNTSGRINLLRYEEAIKKIVCVNKVEFEPIQISKVIDSPMHSGSGISFSFNGNYEEKNVCKAMGYEDGVYKSSKPSNKAEEGYGLVVKDNGAISNARFGLLVGQIICLGLNREESSVFSYRVEKPIHKGTELYYSTDSSPDGICKSLGYHNGVEDSIQEGEELLDLAIKVDSSGSVYGAGQHVPFVEELFCLIKR